jgi:hypothetical protein
MRLRCAVRTLAADVEQRADMRMVERGDRARFTVEAGAAIGRRRAGRRRDGRRPARPYQALPRTDCRSRKETRVPLRGTERPHRKRPALEPRRVAGVQERTDRASSTT